MRHHPQTLPAMAAHGQSTPAPEPEAVEGLHTLRRPKYTGPVLDVAHDGPVLTIGEPAQSWQTWQVPVASNAASIANQQDTRRSASLVNVGSVTVYVGPRADVTITSGFPLLPGSTMTVNARSAIFAVVANGGTGSLGVFAEYEDGGR